MEAGQVRLLARAPDHNADLQAFYSTNLPASVTHSAAVKPSINLAITSTLIPFAVLSSFKNTVDNSIVASKLSD
jgi:hypothetical protein